MYAVIASGGKQARVAEGEQVHLELLTADDSETVELRPVLLVDGDTVLATPDQLKGAAVKGRIVGTAKGPKIDGFTYKRRTNQRRRYGHRQQYSVVEITSITKG
ncbi:MAG: 50S ribosomal protein L21 [Ilumatobacteraceae bacterium]